ncbi:hypothetical protein R6Q59_016090, partial [Mikania micrantha]
FGVVALELACGRKPVECKPQEEQIRLIEWVWELYGTDTLIEAADPHLGLDFVEEEIKRLMIVGLWCVHPHSEPRPSMRQVIQGANHWMSLANQRASLEYQEAVKATEENESSSLGFIRPTDFKSGVNSLNSAIIKQNNTLIYLVVKQVQKLERLSEEVEKVKRPLEELGKREMK